MSGCQVGAIEEGGEERVNVRGGEIGARESRGTGKEGAIGLTGREGRGLMGGKAAAKGESRKG